MSKVGERVAAVLSADKDPVRWLGEGVYEGEFVPGPEAEGWLAKTVRELGHTNPRIRLDSGQVVWGCECWWGPVDAVKRHLQGRTLTLVDIDEARRACTSASTSETETEH